MSADELRPQPLSEADQVDLALSMARHPAGKRRVIDLTTCPTCGQRPSGALGDPHLSLRS